MAVFTLLLVALAFSAQQTPVAELNPVENVELTQPAFVDVDNALEGYQAQVASSSPLDAMSILDAIGDVVLWKLEGYDISWNPEDQTLQVFLNGVAVPDVAAGIDAQGRQAFVIPLPDSEEFLAGWVDVDMVHNRIIMRSTSLPIDMVIPFVPNDDGTINLSVSKGRGCACMRRGTQINWCPSSNNCVNRTTCLINGRRGRCLWRAPRLDPPVITQN